MRGATERSSPGESEPVECKRSELLMITIPVQRTSRINLVAEARKFIQFP